MVKHWSKSIQTSSTRLLCSLVTPYSRPCRRPATVPATPMRRPSANLARRARTPVLIPTEPCPFSPSPFFLPLALRRARTDPPPAFVPTAPRRPSSISARPNLPHLALHLLHPSPSSIEPSRGRIKPAIAGRHCHSRRGPPPSSISYLRPSSAQIEGAVSFLVLSSPSPTLSP